MQEIPLRSPRLCVEKEFNAEAQSSLRYAKIGSSVRSIIAIENPTPKPEKAPSERHNHKQRICHSYGAFKLLESRYSITM